jgi:diadenylate cyclase
MANSWLPFAALPKFTMTTAFDILVVAILIYQFILIVRGRRAAHILAGVGILALVYVGAIWLRLELLRTILATLAPYTAIALIVMFQSELRRIMARLGRRPFFGISRLERREVADEILLALPRLSQQRIGALIVVERKIGLKTFIESGVLIDAQISRDLLCAIFQPGGALHDGAVIVQGDRIAAGACFLPLTTNPALLTELGTRHRAAIGITEETDCLALVVSEESGRVSVADFGEIELDVPLERVEQKLTGRVTRREARPAPVHPAPEAAVEDSPLEGSSVQRP